MKMGEMLTATSITADEATSILSRSLPTSTSSSPSSKMRPPVHRLPTSNNNNNNHTNGIEENGVHHHGYSSSKCSNIENPIVAGSNANLIAGFNFRHSSKPLFRLHDGSTIAYGQFEQRIGNYAAHLRLKYGVRKGDRVAAQVNKSPDSIALYMATLKVGAIYVPLNTDYKSDEIRYFLTNSAPCLFVCRLGDRPSYESLVRSVNGSMTNGFAKVTCRVVDEMELAASVLHPIVMVKRNLVDESMNNGSAESAAEAGAPAVNGHRCPNGINHHHQDVEEEEEDEAEEDLARTERMDAEDLAAICYTSGTTGKPKGAMITHGNLLSNARALCETWMITDRDVLLHALPIYHVHGLFVALNTILVSGASLVLLPRFDMDLVIDWLPRSTMMMGVPTYYTRLLQCPKLTAKRVDTCRLFISGSAPLLENTWNEFKERTGRAILERYGMTEGQMVCSNPYEGIRKPGTVGRPLPLVTVRIRNGGLEYVGPNLFKGYWRMPEKTKEDFTPDGYFISGDLAELDDDGYVRILGRTKDLIITGGLNVYPKEVENVIDALAGVQESSVIGVTHPDFGEAVVAIVVLKQHEDEDEDDDHRQRMSTDEEALVINDEIDGPVQSQIINVLKEKIAGFKVPKRVYIQKQLPRNAMGKVQKNLLRERYQHVFEN